MRIRMRMRMCNVGGRMVRPQRESPTGTAMARSCLCGSSVHVPMCDHRVSRSEVVVLARGEVCVSWMLLLHLHVSSHRKCATSCVWPLRVHTYARVGHEAEHLPFSCELRKKQ